MSITHKSEAEVLKRRALDFLKQARRALEEDAYDVSCFLAEQSLQLYFKSVLLKIAGDYPRTHSIRRLIGEVSRILSSEDLKRFVSTNRIRLSLLEDAYLMARYFVKEYDKEDARDMIKLVEEVMNIINKILGEGD